MAEDVETVIAQGTFFVVRPSQGLGKMSIFTKRETITLKKAASKVAQCTAPPQRALLVRRNRARLVLAI